MTNRDPTAPVLKARPDEVHVWRVRLDLAPERVATLQGLLAPDERRRMERFKFEVHRRRYCVGRATLRRLLGGYLGMRPGAVSLVYGEQGKPALDLTSASLPDLRFNVSHSADEALVAVALGREVGVDIERIKEDTDFEGIAQRFFSEGEVERLRNLPAELWPESFFDCWTRKESYLKACGGGLRLPLRDFDVTLGPGVPAKLLRVQWDAMEVGRWSMAALEVQKGFRGAITVEGQGWKLRSHDAAELK